jgi:Arc/MetJ-type ribon-helix-helix transcriptional regulator
MNSESFSITLPSSLLEFIEHYKTVYQYQSGAQVIEKALELLQQQELEDAYRQASEDVDPVWDSIVSDGLSDETW